MQNNPLCYFVNVRHSFFNAPRLAAGSNQVYWLSVSAVLMALSMVCIGIGFFWWLESIFAGLSLRHWLGNSNISEAIFIMITLRTAVAHAQVCDFTFGLSCVLYALILRAIFTLFTRCNVFSA